MTRRLAVLAASAAAMCIPSMAPAIIIDDFTQGATTLELGGAAPATGNIESQQTGTEPQIIRTQRDVQLSVVDNPDDRIVRFEIVPGLAKSFYAEGPNARGFVVLDYDGLDAEGSNGTVSASVGGMNLNLSAEDRFNILFFFADLGVDIRIDAFTYGGGSSSRTFAIPSGIDNPAGQGVEIFFSSFTTTSGGGVNWSDVDRLLFTFDGLANGKDFAIGRIQAVPEPASMAAIGIGVLGLLARRRRK